MSKQQQYAEAMNNLQTLRIAMEPHSDAITRIYLEYFNERYTAEQVANELGIQERTVIHRWKELGCDYRLNETKEPEAFGPTL